MTNKEMFIDVAIGLAARKTFTYKVPEILKEKALRGQRVIVPLGKRAQTGFIVGIPDVKGEYEVREVVDIPDDIPLVPSGLIEITRWVSSYYHSPWGQTLGMALPPGLEEGMPARPRKGVHEESGQVYASSRLTLNLAQDAAVKRISSALEEGMFKAFLLHGATGSGKTEVYLRVIEVLRDSGKGAIVLVPEISLTPQLVRRFRERFGGCVAVLHSGLTDSQRRSEWLRIRKGEASVAVGARSAVFAPFPELGIIVVDEEHDPSYKQEEGVRYNARDVAVMRANFSSCPVVLGSATPSIESYHNAKSGKYELLALPDRAAGRPMPSVRVLDLKEFPAGSLTPPLLTAARERLTNGEQVLFFLNRRGYSDFLLCRDCGHVPMCPSCSISLTYHKGDMAMRCHWCGEGQTPPDACPKCGGARIKYMGGGTEKLEREIENLLEGNKITRVDRDTVRTKGGYAKLLGEVAEGKSSILLGTQMVAKGHDLPGIGLVGVVLADYGLHHPDFRAAERTFQVVTQVAGRSGRGDIPGEVIVQTYQPEHYSLTYASRHDYTGFYEEEIKFRRELMLPPFSRLALLMVKAIKQEKAQAGAKAALRHFTHAARAGGVEILGPAPAPVKRARGKYRYFLVLKSSSSKKLHSVIEAGLKSLDEKKALSACAIEVDVDPQSMV